MHAIGHHQEPSEMLLLQDYQSQTVYPLAAEIWLISGDWHQLAAWRSCAFGGNTSFECGFSVSASEGPLAQMSLMLRGECTQGHDLAQWVSGAEQNEGKSPREARSVPAEQPSWPFAQIPTLTVLQTRKLLIRKPGLKQARLVVDPRTARHGGDLDGLWLVPHAEQDDSSDPQTAWGCNYGVGRSVLARASTSRSTSSSQPHAHDKFIKSIETTHELELLCSPFSMDWLLSAEAVGHPLREQVMMEYYEDVGRGAQIGLIAHGAGLWFAVCGLLLELAGFVLDWTNLDRRSPDTAAAFGDTSSSAYTTKLDEYQSAKCSPEGKGRPSGPSIVAHCCKPPSETPSPSSLVLDSLMRYWGLGMAAAGIV